MFTQRAIVLSARKYTVTDKETRQTNSGVTIQYYPEDNLNPCIDESAISPLGEIGARGQKVIDDSLPANMFDLITAAPAVYDLTLNMVSAKNQRGQSKAQLKVVGLKYVSDFAPKAATKN